MELQPRLKEHYEPGEVGSELKVEISVDVEEFEGRVLLLEPANVAPHLF